LYQRAVPFGSMTIRRRSDSAATATMPEVVEVEAVGAVAEPPL
jgi:hypothetical protein